MVHSKFFDEQTWGFVNRDKSPVGSQASWYRTYDECVAEMKETGRDALLGHSYSGSEYFCFDYDCHDREFTADELKEIEALKSIASWDTGTSGKGVHFYIPKFEMPRSVRNKTRKAEQ